MCEDCVCFSPISVLSLLLLFYPAVHQQVSPYKPGPAQSFFQFFLKFFHATVASLWGQTVGFCRAPRLCLGYAMEQRPAGGWGASADPTKWLVPVHLHTGRSCSETDQELMTWGCGWLCSSVRCRQFCIFCLPSISLNGMVKPSKMPPALAEMGFNKSLLSWDHLLKPNELADVGCEMYPCMSCRQLQPFESFAVHEERILMWLLMSTEDIRHLKMCPMTKLSTRTNEIQFVLGVLCR